MGVLVGFIGLLLLPFAANEPVKLTDITYASLILTATVCYAVNVNMVHKYLHEIDALNIASVAFSFLIIPCILILAATGYFNLDFNNPNILEDTGYSILLGLLGSAIASVLFYILVKKAGAVFASLVTYGIPVVAVAWGLIYGEKITVLQLGCLAIILAGVYLVNKTKKESIS